ncbi:MAG: 2-hydroxychromene-2-carboxylate isomerase [Betaproteobacteria bacterium]|nr:2-hydroxychromene-2-carboxylate isomerase [Betaproteobacteria bacterium]
MPSPIDFYFDFSSPYGYLGAQKVEALAAKHGRTVAWHPILLGAIFKITGGRPLPELPMKGEYAKRDFARSAAFLGIPFKYPTIFPISSVAPSRACYWAMGKDAKKGAELVKALYKAYFVEDRNISDAATVIEIAAGLGFKADEVGAALNDPAVKEKTKAEVDAAIARGVFGSPYIMIDGEPFWGVDRFEQMERWLSTGGW